MNNIILEDGASTPLSDEEKNGLKLDWITTRTELNAAEHKNIQKAERWAWDRKHKSILTEDFIKKLHKHMFGSVWKWAGQFRQSERNIGVCPWQISFQTKLLLDDVEYWKIHRTYINDEIAIRFHQRFTLIHPFPNGNGRLARLLTDLLIVQLGNPLFTWGGKNLIQEIPKDRRNYIGALREADKEDYTKLLTFARS